MKRSSQSKKELLRLKARRKIAFKYYARLIIGYAVFFLSVVLFGFLLNKTIETIFIIAGYFCTRFVVPKIKHFNTTQKCITATSLTFFFAIAVLCIPKNISVIWAVIVGCVIPLIMYAESLLFDKKPFNVDECTEDELREQCRKKHLSEENTELAVQFFILKTKQSEIADNLCIDEKSVQQRKRRLKQKLNNIEQ